MGRLRSAGERALPRRTRRGLARRSEPVGRCRLPGRGARDPGSGEAALFRARRPAGRGARRTAARPRARPVPGRRRAGGGAALPAGSRTTDPPRRRPRRAGDLRPAARPGLVPAPVPRGAAGGAAAGARRGGAGGGVRCVLRRGSRRAGAGRGVAGTSDCGGGLVIELGGRPLTVADVVEVAREGAAVTLARGARERMRASRAVIERALRENQVVYGVTTGFGELKDRRIGADQVR